MRKEPILSVNIENLYTKYGPMVLRRCRQLLRNEDLALDAMQDVFVKMIDKSDLLKARYPSSLLYTMATNHCLNLLAKEKRSGSDNGILEKIAAFDKQEEKVLAGMFLDQLFSSQKPSTRTIAVLHYVDGLSLKETAELSGLSVSGVRKRLRKLREAGLMLESETSENVRGERSGVSHER